MIETLDFNMNFEDAQQTEADKRLMVTFFKSTIKNEAKSIEAGRPIFDEIDLVRIISPGSRDSFIGDATEEYQRRFPNQWARYKQGQDQQAASGTPLNQLPWMTMSQVAEFNAVNVHTVEQLVGMPDSLSMKFMGHHQIKQRAQAYLEAATSAAPTLKLQAEIDKRDEELRQQREVNATLLARLEALEVGQKANKVPTAPK